MRLADILSPKLAKSWLAQSTGEGVTVAVLDTGIDWTHEAIDRESVIQSVEVVSEENLVVVTPIDESSATSKSLDPVGHGTACGGIILQNAPKVKLVSVRVIGANASGSGDQFLAGLEWVLKEADPRPDIVNLSLGTTHRRFAQALLDLVEEAYYRDIILVAAGPNLNVLGTSYPSKFSSLISVDNESFENPFDFEFHHGREIEFSASGIYVRAPDTGGRYRSWTGTSFACPHITAAVARLKSLDPRLTPFQIKTILHSMSEVKSKRVPMGERSDADPTDLNKEGDSQGADEGKRPETLTAARGGKADNLKEIKGIGPKLEKLCNSLGFYHFDQIAAWTADEVVWVDANLDIKGRVTRDEWVEQASILGGDSTKEFSNPTSSDSPSNGCDSNGSSDSSSVLQNGKSVSTLETNRVRDFQINGFCSIQEFLDETEIGRLRKSVSGCLEGDYSIPEENFFRSGDSNQNDQVAVIRRLDEYVDEFSKLKNDPRLLALAEELFDAPLEPVCINFINKHAQAQSTQPHQDSWIFARWPADALTVWIALDRIDSQNGCLSYVRGSHWQGFRQHKPTTQSHCVIRFDEADGKAEVAMHVKPGDALVHHSYTIHRSLPNLSDRPRWAVAIPFARKDSVELSRKDWVARQNGGHS